MLISCLVLLSLTPPPPGGDRWGRIMEPRDKYQYFIITAGRNSGRICYIGKEQFALKTKRGSPIYLSVRIMDFFEESVRLDEIKELTKQEAEFLYALESDKERLAAFWEREGLDLAPTLRQSSQVAVKVNEEWCQGVVRYIGGITRTKYPDPITGTFFGIELQVRLCVCVYM